MVANLRRQVVHPASKCHSLSAQDKLVKVLPVLCRYVQTGIHIAVHEYVIENQYVGAGTAPNTVLERRWLCRASTGDYHLGWVSSSQASALGDGQCLAACQRS
jgi:hypothetical protein